MVPPASSTAARRAPSPRPEAGRGASRPPLKVVPVRGGRALGRRLVSILPVVMVVGALLAVVIGQALLANGQVRLGGVDKQLQAEQGVHRQAVLQVATLETPPAIVGQAMSHGMVRATITELPYVSLTTPIATPKVTPAATPPVTTTTLAPAK